MPRVTCPALLPPAATESTCGGIVLGLMVNVPAGCVPTPAASGNRKVLPVQQPGILDDPVGGGAVSAPRRSPMKKDISSLRSTLDYLDAIGELVTTDVE